MLARIGLNLAQRRTGPEPRSAADEEHGESKQRCCRRAAGSRANDHGKRLLAAVVRGRHLRDANDDHVKKVGGGLGCRQERGHVGLDPDHRLGRRGRNRNRDGEGADAAVALQAAAGRRGAHRLAGARLCATLGGDAAASRVAKRIVTIRRLHGRHKGNDDALALHMALAAPRLNCRALVERRPRCFAPKPRIVWHVNALGHVVPPFVCGAGVVGEAPLSPALLVGPALASDGAAILDYRLGPGEILVEAATRRRRFRIW